MGEPKCPSKAQLTTMLRESVQNSVKKGYHKTGMDFSKVHSSGVSKILLKGESYSASPALAKVRMQEVWHWSGSSGTLFLDAPALLGQVPRLRGLQQHCLQQSSRASPGTSQVHRRHLWP
jgi:hypothetical protein